MENGPCLSLQPAFHGTPRGGCGTISPGALRYVYLTEPGEYALTIRVGLRVNGEAAELASETIRLRVPEN